MEKRNDTILAEGEVTGHAHRAVGPEVAVFGVGHHRELHAPMGCTVTHEEHQPQTVAPGQHDVLRVQEYDPFAKEIRSVRD